MTINVLIWHEHRHEQTNKLVQDLYPKGMDGALKKAFTGHKDFSVSSVRLDDDAEHGLSQKRLNETDVLIWWAIGFKFNFCPVLNSVRPG